MVRLGTYGDPAAVPSYVWESLLSRAKGWTGYRHQAKQSEAAFNSALISCNRLKAMLDAQKAWQNGISTFRVVNSYDEIEKAKK